ncbi:unnamed protein product [Discosporangium mesarthrocarpum]
MAWGGGGAGAPTTLELSRAPMMSPGSSPGADESRDGSSPRLGASRELRDGTMATAPEAGTSVGPGGETGPRTEDQGVVGIEVGEGSRMSQVDAQGAWGGGTRAGEEGDDGAQASIRSWVGAGQEAGTQDGIGTQSEGGIGIEAGSGTGAEGGASVQGVEAGGPALGSGRLPRVEDGGSSPGASRLACIVASAVMAGELSLLATLATGGLVTSHTALNRNPSNKQAPLDARAGAEGGEVMAGAESEAVGEGSGVRGSRPAVLRGDWPAVTRDDAGCKI